MKFSRLFICFFCLFPWCSLLAQDEFDWEAATAVFHKSRSGEILTPAEKELLAEAKKRRQGGERRNGRPDPTDGDGTNDSVELNPNAVPEEASPFHELDFASADGKELTVAYRVPPGDGPFPAILFFHGGMGERSVRHLIPGVLSGPTQNEFLRLGYVAVNASYRSYPEEPSSRGPIEDAAAAIKAVSELPQVDPDSVVAFGGSGGGSICLDLASVEDIPLAAVVAGEPATVIYTGMLKHYDDRFNVMDPESSHYTGEVKSHTEEKISRISRPILVHHGDIHALKYLNLDHVFPAIEAAGKDFTLEMYPGENHGFYWGKRVGQENFDKVIRTSAEFFSKHLEMQPVAWEP